MSALLVCSSVQPPIFTEQPLTSRCSPNRGSTNRNRQSHCTGEACGLRSDSGIGRMTSRRGGRSICRGRRNTQHAPDDARLCANNARPQRLQVRLTTGVQLRGPCRRGEG